MRSQVRELEHNHMDWEAEEDQKIEPGARSEEEEEEEEEEEADKTRDERWQKNMQCTWRN
jgi:hypothetical protein